MTLLTALFAALISTVVWYFKDGSNRMQTGTLSLMYWGASLMWLVDAVFEYVNDGATGACRHTKRLFTWYFRGRTWNGHLAGHSSDQRSQGSD